jgi:hypothetical protein
LSEQNLHGSLTAVSQARERVDAMRALATIFGLLTIVIAVLPPH